MTIDLLRVVLVGRDREIEAAVGALTSGRRGAAITGPYGSGKTVLARVVADKLAEQFPGGIAFVTPSPPDTPGRIIADHFRLPLSARSLLVIDEADRIAANLKDFELLLKQDARLSILLTGVEQSWRSKLIRIIPLRPLSRKEMIQLAQRRLQHNDPQLPEELTELARGNVRFLDSLIGLVEGSATPRELLIHLQDFRRSGIIDVDGNPISSDDLRASPIITDVVSANERISIMVREKPEAVYSLSSREFEELVAELLNEQGYAVELTPPSKDGGFDMYAARKNGLGEFLFLVECKRYAPGHPVGVQIVRALHGVVQQEQATAGIVVTTSRFTKGAIEFQQSARHKLSLRDYIHLKEWLTTGDRQLGPF